LNKVENKVNTSFNIKNEQKNIDNQIERTKKTTVNNSIKLKTIDNLKKSQKVYEKIGYNKNLEAKVIKVEKK